MVTVRHSVIWSLLVLGIIRAQTTTAAPMIGLEVVAEGLTAPVAFAVPNDGSARRFLVEQIGRIRILRPDGTLQAEPFLDIQDKLVPLVDTFDERGLLGLAFHPDFKSNRRFYVYYCAPMRRNAPLRPRLYWSYTAHLSEFKVSRDDPNKANPISERILLQIDQPQFNHNGGGLVFGPDRYLYVSLGDGGYANDQAIGHSAEGNGQDPSNLLGAVLRLDVDRGDPYGIPADNPFVGKRGYREEIFAYGFRNPWRMSFDSGGQQALIVADVGQNSYEEVNVVTAGGNYGWSRKEGTHCFDPAKPNDHPAQCADSVNGVALIDPVLEYPNKKALGDKGIGFSVTGGYVYRGKAMPELNGAYIFGDWSTQHFGAPDGSLFIAQPAAQSGAMWPFEELRVAGTPGSRIGAYVLAFGEDAAGELYVLTSISVGPTGSHDKVYKIVPAK